MHNSQSTGVILLDSPYTLLQQLPSSPVLQYISSSTALWLQCASSSDSPVAIVYPLQQLCGCSVSALLSRKKASESWRTQFYYARRLGGDCSLESEPERRVSQGFYGLALLGPCLGDGSEVRQGSRCGTSLQKQMCGEGLVRGSWLDFAQSSWPGSLLSTFLLGHFLLYPNLLSLALFRFSQCLSQSLVSPSSNPVATRLK